jgi:hypothetical protein
MCAVVFVLGTARRIPQARPSYFYHDRLIDKRPGRIVILVFKAHSVLVRSPVPPSVLASSPLWPPTLLLIMLLLSRRSKPTGNNAYVALQPLVSPEDDMPPRKEAIDQLAAAVVSSSILPLSFVLTGMLLFVERLRAYPLGHVCFPFGELGSGRVRDFLSLGRRFAETRRLPEPERGHQEPIQPSRPVCRRYDPCRI